LGEGVCIYAAQDDNNGDGGVIRGEDEEGVQGADRWDGLCC
jgi:hypothetical protein